MKDRFRFQKHNIVFACFFTVLTAAVLLYVFVIPRAYRAAGEAPDRTFDFEASAPSATPGASGGAVPTPSAGPLPSGDAASDPEAPFEGKFTDGKVLSGEDYYSDANINVRISVYREYDTDIYVAEVYVRTAEYFRTAFARNTFGRNLVDETSDIARNNGAVLAVNGDYYGARNKGFVIRNGVLYRSSSGGRDCLAVMEDGSFRIVAEKASSASELLKEGAWQAFSFGPGLLRDGDILVNEYSEVDVHLTSNPRTAVAMIEPLHYLFLVSDGRTDESAGLTLYQLAEFLLSLGARDAYNLDGGGSSTMYFMGEVVNRPTTHGTTISERRISDIVYVG